VRLLPEGPAQPLFGHAVLLQRMRTPYVDGGFREALVCKAEQAIPIPDTMSLSAAAFTEPVAVCLHAASRPGSLLSKRVLVLGAGPIGTIIALLQWRGALARTSSQLAM
jgi:L-idonate 5-dehydrogenase